MGQRINQARRKEEDGCAVVVPQGFSATCL